MPLDGSGGFLLSLLTESFAVRALIGSLAAALLALLVVRHDVVRHRTARRVTVLAPVLVAAGAAVAVAREGGAYLPQLWVAGGRGPAGEILELLGEWRVFVPGSGVDVLVGAYLVCAGVLLGRRLAGARRLRRLLAGAIEPVGYGRLVPTLYRLSDKFGVAAPRLVLLEDCPGGAFTAGLRRPALALDPVLVDRLDDRELEGLLAHELAHLKRRDNHVGLAVGLFRDLVFFLPPVHLAQRWLRREQEESADELASEHTGRPVALASSILKVWDRHRERPPAWRPRLACSALGTAEAAPPAARDALALRVERLLEGGARALSPRRRRMEIALAMALLVAGGLAAWVVPGWIARDLNAYSLSFIYLTAPAAGEVEAPAFATFRALTTEAAARPRFRPGPATASHALTEGALTEGALGEAAVRDPALCPCVESVAQLRAGEVFEADPPSPRMLWSAGGHDAWQLSRLRERGGLHSRPLLTLTEGGPQVGFFVVGRPPAS